VKPLRGPLVALGIVAFGCSLGPRSPRVLDDHEPIHVYTGPLGHPPALFEEGLAEALAPRGRSFMAPQQSWRDILATPRQPDGIWPAVDHAGGAWFITHLMRRFGPERFRFSNLSSFEGASVTRLLYGW
jgi:hypothetical protein